MLDDLPADDVEMRARCLACLAGGLFQDGAVDVEVTEAMAREAMEVVGEVADPLTAAQVISRARKALIDIDPPEIQLERARRILGLAGRSDYHRSLGLLAAIVDLLHLGRVGEARQETERYRDIAERTGAGLHRYHIAALDGMWSLHDGRGDDARVAIEEAERHGRFGGLTVLMVTGGQRLWLAYETGDEAALRGSLPLLDELAVLSPATPLWRCARAWVASLLGDDDEARSGLQGTAARSPTASPTFPAGPCGSRSSPSPPSPATSSPCRGHDVGTEARGILGQLRSHTARSVLIGWPTVYLGPTSRFEVMASVAAGHPTAATETVVTGPDEIMTGPASPPRPQRGG